MDIFLNKNIIENLDLNNYDIATYVALRSIYNPYREEFYISSKMLAYELFGCDIPRSAVKYIQTSIHHLSDLHLFDIVSDLTENEFVIKNRDLYFDTYDAVENKRNLFTIISMDEVHKIMSLNIKKAKYPLLRLFINVIGTFNKSQGIYVDVSGKQNFVGYMSQDYIGSLSGLNRCVVSDYFSILEEEKLLYVYRHNKAVRDGGKLKSISNHYGRYRDKDDIKQFALQYEKTIFGVNMEQSNQKRSLMAKYNHIVSNPDKNLGKYSMDELVDIYNYVSDRNKRQKSLNLNDIKDLSVLEHVLYNDMDDI